MLDKNKALLLELEKLDKGAYTGQITLNWLKGVVKNIWFPQKPIVKDLSEKIGGTDNG
jgi:hypothetical protein